MLAEDDHLYTNSWLLAVTLIAEKRHYNNDGMESCMGHFSGPPFAHEFGRTFSGEFHDCLDDASLNICYSDALLEGNNNFFTLLKCFTYLFKIKLHSILIEANDIFKKISSYS